MKVAVPFTQLSEQAKNRARAKYRADMFERLQWDDYVDAHLESDGLLYLPNGTEL